MLELGPEGAEMHREAGMEIARSGIDVLWGVRGLAQEMVEGARRAGMEEMNARYFESSEEAAEAVVKEVRDRDLILVKGSRGVSTDKVVAALRAHFPLLGADERI
jgi:UDP-N-acetylmuramoyl-tripeptide--D-alanyl-D-alanine ligase